MNRSLRALVCVIIRDALNCVPTQHAHVALIRKVNKQKVVQDDAMRKVMLFCTHKFSIRPRQIDDEE